MRLKSLGILIILCFATIQSQEIPDSISGRYILNNNNTNKNEEKNFDNKVKELDEVVVEGQVETLKRDGVSVVPTQSQANAATGGIDLLRRMSFPLINVDISSNNVSTISGYPVDVFINSRLASADEVENLNLKNVLRVEYFDFPEDTRYRGAHHVINFVMKPIVWGGYTRLSAAYYSIAKNNFNSRLYSQLTREKMTYDLYACYDYDNNHHLGLDELSQFHLLDAEGIPYVQDRLSETTYSRSRTYNIPVTARVMYNSENINVTNRVGFRFNKNPDTAQHGKLSFGSQASPDYEYFRQNRFISRNVNWEGDYFFKIPRNMELTLAPYFMYSTSGNNSTYVTSVPESEPIVTLSHERIILTGAELYLRRVFDKRYSIMFLGSGRYSHFHVDYAGSAPYTNRFNNFGGKLGIVLSASWPKIQFGARAIYELQRSEVNGVCAFLHSPSIIANVNYILGRSHRLSADVRYFTTNPGDGDKSPNAIQTNEFLYKIGNPYLRTFGTMFANINYIWLASRKFNLGGTVMYGRAQNLMQTLYSLFDEGKALVKSEVNSGYLQLIGVFIKGTYKPIKNLELQADLRYAHKRQKGVAANMYNAVNMIFKAYYYVDKFNFGASYERCGKEISSGGWLQHLRPNYNVSAGWSKSGWNIDLILNNFFRYNWLALTKTMHSPLYEAHQRVYDSYNHFSVNFKISYTFRYGQNIKARSEVIELEGPGSAILQ